MTTQTLIFAGIQCCRPDATQKVLLFGNWFEMRRVKTSLVTTQVVDHKPLRNRTADQFVHQTVRSMTHTTNPHAAVAIAIKSFSETPATIRIEGELLRKTINIRYGHGCQ